MKVNANQWIQWKSMQINDISENFSIIHCGIDDFYPLKSMDRVPKHL